MTVLLGVPEDSTRVEVGAVDAVLVAPVGLAVGRAVEARNGDVGVRPREDVEADRLDGFDSRRDEFEGGFLGVLDELGTLDIVTGQR